MAKNKNTNPYRITSAYHNVFNALREASKGGITSKGITRSELSAMGFTPSDITVVLSPRQEGESRGDCRGNMSAQGHVYFVDCIKKAGEEKRFRLRWRKVELEPLRRMQKKSRDAVKVKAKSPEKEVAPEPATIAETQE
jgi:hypothetical protein